MARTKGLEQKKVSGRAAGGAIVKKENGTTDVGKKPRKKGRRKRVKSEIRKLQTGKKCTQLLASKASVARLCREIISDSSSMGDMRITPNALEALHVAAEEVVTEAMTRANEIARTCGNREGVLLRDFKMACKTLPHFVSRK